MDKDGNIYRAPEEEIPQEDVDRLRQALRDDLESTVERLAKEAKEEKQCKESH